MKTKLLVTVLVVALLATACGGPAASPASAPSKPFRIAVVMPSATTDLAFSQSMYSALLSVQKDMGGEGALELK